MRSLARLAQKHPSPNKLITLSKDPRSGTYFIEEIHDSNQMIG